MTYAKKQTLNRWCPLLAVLMLMFARASTAAAVPQASGGAQPPRAVETASASVVPRLIQFSGIVKDAEGEPPTGSLELTFSLYQFQEGGSPLWVETQTAHLDSQGRYTALLGAASPRRPASGRFHQWDGAVVGGSTRPPEIPRTC